MIKAQRPVSVSEDRASVKANAYDYHTPATRWPDSNYYRRLKHSLFFGLLISYLLPITLITIYFNHKFDIHIRKSSTLRLAAMTDSLRNTIDLFMQKRVVNIFNLFHLRTFSVEPSQALMDSYLANLLRGDDAFLDVGLIDPQGIQTGYTGPYPHLRAKDYSNESWYVALIDQSKSYIITDLYLGLRRQPHFTIGVKQLVDGAYYVIRCSIYPDKLQKLLNFPESDAEAFGYLTNREGIYQAVSPGLGDVLEPAQFSPSRGRESDVVEITFQGQSKLAAYAWLKEVPWCLVMLQPVSVFYRDMYGLRNTMMFGSTILVLVIMIIVGVIISRMFRWTESLVQDKAELKSQLYHANKLVSVGQLAGGVAHEINNPLAIIESESGLIRDMLNPDIDLEATPEAIIRELDEIDKAVHRAKGVTQNILSFVRKTDPQLVPCDINKLLDNVVSGIKEQEFKVSNITLIRDYSLDLPELMIDPDQLRQVLLNLINNASDAMTDGGTLTLRTRLDGDVLKTSVIDTGIGMSTETMERIFMPFFSTKKVGKSTGLGLPISLNIVEGFGGRMEVLSTPGRGTEFTIVLPISGKASEVKKIS